MKKQITTLNLFLSLLCFTMMAVGQNCYPNYESYLDVNKVRARYFDDANMFGIKSNGYIVPYSPAMSPADYRSPAFVGSLWMGGIDGSGQLHVAAQTYAQGGVDFFSGPIKTGGADSCGAVFKATGTPIRQGLLQLSNGFFAVLNNGGFDVYDPFSDIKYARFIPSGNLQYSLVELSDGRLMIYGGEGSTAPGVDSTTFIASPPSYFVTPGPDLHIAHTRGTATLLPSGEVLFASRFGAEVFDPLTGTSTVTSARTSANDYSVAKLLPNGQVWVTGGRGMFPVANEETEFYDPGTDTWTIGPDLLAPREFHNLIDLPTGEILIIGGHWTDSLVMKYDPISNVISPAGYLEDAKQTSDAILMSNGEVFVGMGQNNDYVQFYNPTTETTRTLPRRGLGQLGGNLAGGLLFLQMGDGKQFLRYDPFKDEIPGARFRKLWNVSKAEIEAFITDQAAGTVDFSLYPDIETWPGNGNTFAGEDYHLAPFVDLNNDGKYRPEADGDYPCINGDQALWWIINDEGPHSQTEGEPLNVQIKTMSYAYNCSLSTCADTMLDYTTFLRYEVTNKSGQDYDDYYFGYWVDGDIGNWVDDYIGCDTNLNLGFIYNGDPDDETANGYGLNPPAFGVQFLSTPQDKGMTNFMYYRNDYSTMGIPESAPQYYNYLKSVFKDGTHLVDNGLNGFPGTAPGPKINYLFPGDGGFCAGSSPTGWSEVSPFGNPPGDRRFLVSSGPYSFAAGDTLIFDLALLYARDYTNDNLGSVCALKSTAATLASSWTPNTCMNVVLGTSPSPTESTFDFEVFPNPSASDFTVRFPNAGSESIALTLVDLLGRVTHQTTLPKGVSEYTLNGSHLAEGIYLLKAESASRKGVQRVVVQR